MDSKVVGILLKEDSKTYSRSMPIKFFNWIWLTEEQAKRFFGSQEKVAGGYNFWVDENVFRLSDIRIARKFTLEELEKEHYQLPDYFQKAVERESRLNLIAGGLPDGETQQG